MRNRVRGGFWMVPDDVIYESYKVLEEESDAGN